MDVKSLDFITIPLGEDVVVQGISIVFSEEYEKTLARTTFFAKVFYISSDRVV